MPEDPRVVLVPCLAAGRTQPAASTVEHGNVSSILHITDALTGHAHRQIIVPITIVVTASRAASEQVASLCVPKDSRVILMPQLVTGSSQTPTRPVQDCNGSSINDRPDVFTWYTDGNVSIPISIEVASGEATCQDRHGRWRSGARRRRRVRGRIWRICG